MIVQKLKTIVGSSYEMAEKYIAIIAAVNSLHLTEREIQLAAFTAVKGNMSYANVREEFCRLYKTSSPTINNIVSHLKKMGIMIKEGTMIKINPALSLGFKSDVVLQIQLNKKDE